MLLTSVNDLFEVLTQIVYPIKKHTGSYFHFESHFRFLFSKSYMKLCSANGMAAILDSCKVGILQLIGF